MLENTEEREHVKLVVCEFIDLVAQEITKRNPIYEIKSILVGSQKENTRPLLPNEFDFLISLIKLGSYVNVTQSKHEIMYGHIDLKKNIPDNILELLPRDDKNQIYNRKVLSELKQLVIKPTATC